MFSTIDVMVAQAHIDQLNATERPSGRAGAAHRSADPHGAADSLLVCPPA